MDIFFFIYSILYGLPLGVLELPREVSAHEIRNLQEFRDIVTGSEFPL